MADLSREQMQQLARLGAQARLEELRREEAAIRQAFPDLVGGRGARGGRGTGARQAPAGTRRRARGKMSAASRKAVSERMKKFWAARRKAKGK